MSMADGLLHERRADAAEVRAHILDLIAKINSCGITDSFTDVPTQWVDEALAHLRDYASGNQLK